MDAALFTKILSDKHIGDLKKLSYKYNDANISEFVGILKSSVYKSLPIYDFHGNNIVYMDNVAQVNMKSVRLLLAQQDTRDAYGLRAMEEEIASTLTIENIDFNRDSVRKILQGYAPADEQEKRIYGLKSGLEFIADISNNITEKNIYQLYNMAIGQYIGEDDKLNPGAFYRHDAVYIVGQDIEHTGLAHEKLPEYMERFTSFICGDNMQNTLMKAAVIHFYMAYLHPYFDGNGRMARLMQLWYLHQQGFSSALFVPFSGYIERSRNEYYKAYTYCEENSRISGIIDVTPFLSYFTKNVYNKLDDAMPQPDTMEKYTRALSDGLITEKEKDLWTYVLSAYGISEFSTKQLERDFGNAAYATINAFVLKFTKLGILTAQKYSNRVKYKVSAK